jgi:hypothetical protein
MLKLIDPDRAWPVMPPPETRAGQATLEGAPNRPEP